MTLNRSEGDGYYVISDSGRRYGLYEMVTIGNERKTTDCIAIRYEGVIEEDEPSEEIIGFFYGARNIEDSTMFIRERIVYYETKHFPCDANLEGDMIKVF